MELSAVLLLLLMPTLVRPAPASLPAGCREVQSSSMELNLLARNASMEARRVSRDVGGFNISLQWMEAKDMCDPRSLRDKSMPCVGKLLSVLGSYISEVENVSGYDSCSLLAAQVKPTLQKLHQDMSGCVRSVGGRTQAKGGAPEEKSEPIPDSYGPSLCRYVMERLFSFSILTARVFATGNPAEHAGSTPKCS